LKSETKPRKLKNLRETF